MSVLSSIEEGEFAPFYKNYIGHVEGKNIPGVLMIQIDELRKFLEELGEEKSKLSYAEGKWTAKEVLGHISDTDRIMTFRALCFARGEEASLPGFDQDAYVKASRFNELPLAQLLEDYELSRYNSVSLLKNLADEALLRTGYANGSKASVRALFYIIAGHTQHHLNILRERYSNL